MADENQGNDELPPPHSSFAAHFSSVIYDAENDANDDIAPFGTDEGYDEVHDWAERVEDLQRYPTMRFMRSGGGNQQLTASEVGDLDEDDEFVIGQGFTLLRYTGQIDAQGRDLLRDALLRQVESSPGRVEYSQMLADLDTFDVDHPTLQRHRKVGWLKLHGGWNDPEHARWLKALQKKMNADVGWTRWWAASGLELLVLAPTPVGPPGGWIEFTAKRNLLDVMASSGALAEVLMAPHLKLPEDAGIHQTTPETRGLFRDLIHEMTVQTAHHLGIPAPPPALPD